MTAKVVAPRVAPRVRTPTGFWRKYGVGYLFVIPTLVLYVVFVFYPLVASLYLSLTDWNGADPVLSFVGFSNYVKLVQDDLLWVSLGHNIFWMVFGSIGAIGLGLVLAVVLWSTRPRGFTVFRTVYFMPQVLGAAVVGIIWRMIYAPRRGLLYKLGDALDIDFLKHGFLGDHNTALSAVLLASVWSAIGFFFVIFLAGLQNVDQDLIDAAKVDGANARQRFRHVVVPQLSPVITMVIVLGMINSLNIFDIIWAMTGGGPANSTEVIGTYAYTKAFLESQFGYSAALITVSSGLALVMSTAFIRLRERGEG